MSRSNFPEHVLSLLPMVMLAKKYAAKKALLTKEVYPLEEAVDLLTQVSTTTFDGTAELHVVLMTDPTQGDQQVRATVALPHGTGKNVRIAAVVPDDQTKEALAAGASKAGETNVIRDIEKGNLDFDVVIAVPSVMKNLGKVAKILGQKGLMPSPKAGTVTDDPAKTIEAIKKGRIEFRADKQGIVHAVFGKISFGKEKLTENVRILLHALIEAKPQSIKGEYIKSITITPTMGPGIRVDVRSV